jgi:hypothetical protein
VFDCYFPIKRLSKVKRTHFSSTSYYTRWTQLLANLGDRDAEITQQHIQDWFDELYLVPHPEVDRMWSMKKWTSGSDEAQCWLRCVFVI